MKTVALVPVKDLRQAKGRLGHILSATERASLAHNMLAHVLQTIAGSGVVDHTVVISPDVEELDLPMGVIPLLQTRPGLNDALEEAREWAVAHGAEAVLVVFADLPLLSAQDVASMVKLGARPGTIVVAPDRHWHGTNALLSHPPALARFAFGPDSYSRHVALALEAGAYLHVYSSDGTALDVDTPDDLSFFESSYHGSGGSS